MVVRFCRSVGLSVTFHLRHVTANSRPVGGCGANNNNKRQAREREREEQQVEVASDGDRRMHLYHLIVIFCFNLPTGLPHSHQQVAHVFAGQSPASQQVEAIGLLLLVVIVVVVSMGKFVCLPPSRQWPLPTCQNHKSPQRERRGGERRPRR